MGGRRRGDIASNDYQEIINVLPTTGIPSARTVSAINSFGTRDPVLSFASLFEISPVPSAENIIKLLLPAVGTVTDRQSSNTTQLLSSSTTSSTTGGGVASNVANANWGIASRYPNWRTVTYNPVVQTTATTNKFLNTVTSAETHVSSTVINQTMLSRIISFKSSGLRPNTRVYPLFDGVAVDGWCLQMSDAGARSYWGSPLVTNAQGSVQGEFYIPNVPWLNFKIGTRIFKLTDNPADENLASTNASANYFSAGAAVYQQQLISQVNTRFQQTATTVTTNGRSNTYYDPLAQSFYIDSGEESAPGVYITSIDCYFKSKATDGKPVRLEIREMINGVPGQRIVENGICILRPDQVTVSTTSNERTRFIFGKPVYLSNKTEYCFVLKSDSMSYNAYISRLGEFLLNSTKTMSKQPYLGSMFVSQNDSTWTADQLADIKFVINRAKFTPNSSAKLILAPLWPSRRVSYDTSIETYTGQSVVRIFALDHGLRVGKYTSIILDIPGGTPRIASTTTFTGWKSNSGVGYEYLLNGIRESNFSGFKRVTYADAYSFEIELNSDGILTQDILATEDGFVPVNSCTFEPNVKYESLKFVGVNNELTGTGLKVELKGTSYSSIHGNQPELVGDVSFMEIPNLVEIGLPVPKVITSHATSYKEPSLKGSISTRIATTLSTSSEFVAPMFNLQASRLITKSNLLDDPTDIDGLHPVTDWVSEATPDDGIVAARYIIRPISLANPAQSIRVMLSGVVAKGNAIDVYYRTVPSGEAKDIHDYPWLQLEQKTNQTTFASSPNQFYDFTYEVRNSDATPLPEFKTFSVKILLRGTDSCIPPVVKDLRILALAT